MIKKLPRTTILSPMGTVAVHDGETVHKTTLAGLLWQYREHIPWLAVSPQFKWLCPWMPTLPHDYPYNPHVDLVSDMSDRVFVHSGAIRDEPSLWSVYFNIWAIIAWPWGFYATSPGALSAIDATPGLIVDLRDMRTVYRYTDEATYVVTREFGNWLS